MQKAGISSKYFLRNAGAKEPRLGIAASFWALQNRSLPMARALEELCNEGVEYFEVGFREDRLADTLFLLQLFPLQLIGQGWATAANELAYFFERAVDLGAVALNLHLGHAYMYPAEAVDLVGEAQTLSERHGIPFLLETHRGRLTQDLLRMAGLIESMPNLVLTLDLSHYLVAGETLGGSEPMFRKHMTPLLAHTGLIHGRISNGQSIQVHNADAVAFTDLVVELWTGAMSSWLLNAPDDAVLIFEPELGPPPYAFCDPQGVEIFNRRDESRILTQLARRAWTEATQCQP